MAKVKRVSFKTSGKSSVSINNFVKTIESDAKCPKGFLNFCAIAKPSYFPNCQVPRYKVAIMFDPDIAAHKDFLDSLKRKGRSFGVSQFGVETDEGCIVISFQGRDKPITKLVEYGKKRAINVELDNDMPTSIQCEVKFDLKTYTQRKSQETLFTFTPSEIIFHLDERSQNALIAD